MVQPGKYAHMLRLGYWRRFVALTACLFFSGLVAAQNLPPATSRMDLSLPAASGLPLTGTSPLAGAFKANNALSLASDSLAAMLTPGDHPPPQTKVMLRQVCAASRWTRRNSKQQVRTIHSCVWGNSRWKPPSSTGWAYKQCTSQTSAGSC